jgi:hypothetical protein
VAAFLVGTGAAYAGFAAYTGLAGGLYSSLSSSLNYAGVAAFLTGTGAAYSGLAGGGLNSSLSSSKVGLVAAFF